MRIVDCLYPQHPSLVDDKEGKAGVEDDESFPLLSLSKVCLAVHRTKRRKIAQGPDFIPKIWGIINDIVPAILHKVYAKCVRDGKFPKPWKLLRKRSKPVRVPAS